MIILAPLLLSVAAATETVKSEEPVAHFGDTPVYAEEVGFHLRDQLALVAVYFKKSHQVDLSGETWLKSYNGDVPVELLQRRALDACWIAKTIQLLAKEHHVGKELPFPGYSEACNRMNQARLKDREQGRVIYGLAQYSPRQLYKYQMGNLRIQLLEGFADGNYEQGELKLRSAIKERQEKVSLKADLEKIGQLTAGLVLIKSSEDRDNRNHI